MGELANEVRTIVGWDTTVEKLRAHRIADRVAELEARVAELEEAQFTGAAAPLLNRRLPLNDGMSEAEFSSRTAAAELIGLLHDAEQRAASAWAAVGKVVQRDMRVVDLTEVKPDSDGTVVLRVPRAYAAIDTKRNGAVVVAVLIPSAPANPDLLERASVELAEAYQRAKAEEQRQAEQAVAT